MKISPRVVLVSFLVAASPALAEEATEDTAAEKPRLNVSITNVKVALVDDHAELVLSVRVDNVRWLLERIFSPKPEAAAPAEPAKVAEPAETTVVAAVVPPPRKATVGGRVQVLTETVDELGFLVRRILITDRGALFDMTFRQDGALVGVEPAGNATDLPVESSETLEDGLMLDRMRDTSDRLIECARTAETLIVCTAVTPAPRLVTGG